METNERAEIIRAIPVDAKRLTQITLASKAYWGYSENWMTAWSRLLKIDPEYVIKNEVYKLYLEGVISGWYSLVIQPPTAVLDHLWILPEHIGKGLGRMLFMHALRIAREHEVKKLEIESDPHAVGFYTKMGAQYVRNAISDMGRPVPILAIDLVE
ncbi:MAG: GNAT family N-acetyltransferase [Omnitrophica WOR_2 bacterium]